MYHRRAVSSSKPSGSEAKAISMALGSAWGSRTCAMIGGMYRVRPLESALAWAWATASLIRSASMLVAHTEPAKRPPIFSCL